MKTNKNLNDIPTIDLVQLARVSGGTGPEGYYGKGVPVPYDPRTGRRGHPGES